MDLRPTWVLCLVCTHGTPVADSDIAAYSPLPIPPAHHRSRRQRSHHHCSRRRKSDYPCNSSTFPACVALSSSFGCPFRICKNISQASHLRHIILRNLVFSNKVSVTYQRRGSFVVTLSIRNVRPSASFCPNDLLKRLSLLCLSWRPLSSHFIPLFPTALLRRL